MQHGETAAEALFVVTSGSSVSGLNGEEVEETAAEALFVMTSGTYKLTSQYISTRNKFHV